MLFHSVAENVAERICCRNWCRAEQKSVGEKSEASDLASSFVSQVRDFDGLNC